MYCVLLTSGIASCGGSSAPSSFTIGGTVSGLAPGNSVVLQNNGADSLTLTSSSSFKFPVAVAGTESYHVTVATQPAGQNCLENYSQGDDLVADVTNVIIECRTTETLWNFGVGLDGAIPLTSLIQGADGALYGTTSQGGGGNGFGGTSGYGAVFRITLDGHESVLWNFASGADGAIPVGALVIGADGSFYGTTCRGGANGLGVVYKITSAGVESILWNFGAGSDGACPEAGLTLGSDGSFYGTTNDGGSAGYGTVFKLTSSGVETVLWSFGATDDDGRNPQAALLEASNGMLFWHDHIRRP